MEEKVIDEKSTHKVRGNQNDSPGNSISALNHSGRLSRRNGPRETSGAKSNQVIFSNPLNALSSQNQSQEDPNRLQKILNEIKNLKKLKKFETQKINFSRLKKESLAQEAIQGMRMRLEYTQIPTQEQRDPNSPSTQDFFALKNKNSFMLLTAKERYILTENGAILHTGHISEFGAPPERFIYLKQTNSYFVKSRSNLFEKRIDSQLPRLVFTIPGTSGRGREIILKAESSERLVLLEDFISVKIISLKTLKLELSLQKQFSGIVNSYCFYGARSQNLALLSTNSTIELCSLPERKNGGNLVIFQHKLNLEKNHSELANLITVCPNGVYLGVALMKSCREAYVRSRLLLFEILRDEVGLRKVACLGESFGSFYASRYTSLNAVRYIGRFLILFGEYYSGCGGMRAEVYHFDTKTAEWSELAEKATPIGDVPQTGVVRLKDRFYFLSRSGKVVTHTFEI